MDAALEQLFTSQSGVATSSQILSVASRYEFESVLKPKYVERIWHGIYCLGEPTDDLRLRGLDLSCGHVGRRLSVDCRSRVRVRQRATARPSRAQSSRPPTASRRRSGGASPRRRAAGDGGRTAGDDAGVDRDRGCPRAATPAHLGDAGRRAALQDVQPRRDCGVPQFNRRAAAASSLSGNFFRSPTSARSRRWKAKHDSR